MASPKEGGDVLARNVAAARVRRELQQKDLADRMRALGWKWVRQTVGEVENGRRRLSADEIFGLSLALQTSMAALVAPEDEESVITLPSGAQVSAELLRLSARGTVAGRARWDVRWKDNEPLFPPLEYRGEPMGWFRRGEDEPDAG